MEQYNYLKPPALNNTFGQKPYDPHEYEKFDQNYGVYTPNGLSHTQKGNINKKNKSNQNGNGKGNSNLQLKQNIKRNSQRSQKKKSNDKDDDSWKEISAPTEPLKIFYEIPPHPIIYPHSFVYPPQPQLIPPFHPHFYPTHFPTPFPFRHPPFYPQPVQTFVVQEAKPFIAIPINDTNKEIYFPKKK